MTDPSPYQVTPSWTPPPGYHGHGYQPQPTTNGLAMASMIVSIVGTALICMWGPVSLLVCPVGAILGHVARRQIARTGQHGAGMALAGIIVGWAGTALCLIGLGLIVFAIAASPDSPFGDLTVGGML